MHHVLLWQCFSDHLGPRVSINLIWFHLNMTLVLISLVDLRAFKAKKLSSFYHIMTFYIISCVLLDFCPIDDLSSPVIVLWWRIYRFDGNACSMLHREHWTVFHQVGVSSTGTIRHSNGIDMKCTCRSLGVGHGAGRQSTAQFAYDNSSVRPQTTKQVHSSEWTQQVVRAF